MKRLTAAALNVELKSSPTVRELEMKILNTPAASFDPINLSTAISQLAKQQSTNHRAVDRIMQMSTEVNFPPRELSTFCHGIARGRLMNQLPRFILQQIRQQRFTSAYDLSITMWSAAKLNHHGVDSILAKQIEEEIDWKQSKPQDVANTAWALAVFDNRETGKRFAKIIATKRTLEDFNAFDLSNLAWSFAKLQVNDDCSVWEEIYARALQIDWSMCLPQDVSNLLWAMASTSSQNQPALVKITNGLEEMNWIRFKPKELVNTVWALATLSHHNVALKLAEFAITKRSDVTRGQDLASILWSLATVHADNNVLLLQVISQRILGKELIPQEIATTAWACATLSHYDPELMRALADATVQKLGQFNTQDIANTVWAFAKLGHYNRAMMDAVAEEVSKRNRKDFGTRALVNILWSFATLRHSHAKLCQQISNALLLPRLNGNSGLSLQDMSNVMYSFALLNCKNRELFAVIARQARLALEQQQIGRRQDVLILMWSFACCNALRIEAVEQFFQARTGNGDALLAAEDCTVQSANQLHQCSLAWNDAHYGNRSKLIDSIDGAWVYAARAGIADTIFSSKTHVSVTQELREHFDPELVVMETFANGISVDILLPALRTVVEIDGPQHFFANEHETRTGKTLFKLRLLKAAGFQVLSVPVLHSLGHEEHGKTVQKLIQTLLQAAKRQQQPVLSN